MSSITKIPSKNFTIASIFEGSLLALSGFKTSFWCAAIVYLILSFIDQLTLTFVCTEWQVLAHSAVVAIIELPILAGLAVMTLAWVRTGVTDYKLAFGSYRSIVQLTFLLALAYLIGFVSLYLFAFVIGGLIGLVSYSIGFISFNLMMAIIGGVGTFIILLFTAFASVLMLDKKLSPWNALWVSVSAVSPHLFKIMFISLVLLLISASCILLIPIIWVFPFIYVVFVKIYINLFDQV